MRVPKPRVLSRDPEKGLTEYFHYDPEHDRVTIETVQDVTGFVEQNKALLAQSSRHDSYGDVERIASIPDVVLMELSKQGILSPGGAILDRKRLKRWLNDPDNRLFRTREGKV